MREQKWKITYIEKGKKGKEGGEVTLIMLGRDVGSTIRWLTISKLKITDFNKY